jgi:hypothetical protein
LRRTRVDAHGAEHLAAHGIEECPVEIPVRPACHQHFIGPLDLAPDRRVGAPFAQIAGDGGDAARDPLLVQLDAVHRILLR